MAEKTSTVTILTKEDFFKTGENMHIQMSGEYPGYFGVWHQHEYIEIVYVISGRARHKIGDNEYDVKKGDLFVVNMNTPHAFFGLENSDDPLVAYDLMFTPEFFDTSMSGYHSLEALNKSFMFHSLFAGREEAVPYFSIKGSEYADFGELFNKIYQEYKSCDTGYREIIRAYLMQLIITVFRLDAEKKKQTGNHQKQIVSFVTDYIKENYALPISVEQISGLVYLNKDYLGRLYKQYCGMSVGEMIQKVRLKRSCTLLASTDINIAQIANMCGFNDVKFFYKVFKKHMATLPSAYRKSTQKTQ